MNYRDELARKAIHLGSAVCPLIYAWISPALALAGAVPVMLAFIVLDVLRQRHPGLRSWYNRWLGRLMRVHEDRRLCGASYVMIAVVVCIAVYEKPVTIVALLFLSISDALASLVGLKVGGPRWFNKSVAGSATFLLSALVIALVCLPQRPIAGAVGALAATLVEAAPLRLGRVRLDDNLLVPIVGGAVITALLDVG